MFDLSEASQSWDRAREEERAKHLSRPNGGCSNKWHFFSPQDDWRSLFSSVFNPKCQKDFSDQTKISSCTVPTTTPKK